MKKYTHICVVSAVLMIVAGCTKEKQSTASSDVQGRGPSASKSVSERGKALIAEIEKSTGKISIPRLHPPTTHDQFWFQGQGLAPYYVSNSSDGYLMSRWEEGMTPTRSGVAAFQGWIFLQPEGKATVVFQKYLYKLRGQSLMEAFAVKIPDNYDVESRLLNAQWEIKGTILRVAVVKDNPDPKYFNASGGREYDLTAWQTTGEEELSAKKAAEAARESVYSKLTENAGRALALEEKELRRAFLGSPVRADWAQRAVSGVDVLKEARKWVDDEFEKNMKAAPNNHRNFENSVDFFSTSYVGGIAAIRRASAIANYILTDAALERYNKAELSLRSHEKGADGMRALRDKLKKNFGKIRSGRALYNSTRDAIERINGVILVKGTIDLARLYDLSGEAYSYEAATDEIASAGFRILDLMRSYEEKDAEMIKLVARIIAMCNSESPLSEFSTK
jgi:hypothetical protein